MIGSMYHFSTQPDQHDGLLSSHLGCCCPVFLFEFFRLRDLVGDELFPAPYNLFHIDEMLQSTRLL